MKYETYNQEGEMKTDRMKQLLREFEDHFESIGVVSVTLADESLCDQIQEYAAEQGGEIVTHDPDGDGTFLEFQFEDPIEAEEFSQFLLGSDWFGDEIIAVSYQSSEEGHIEHEDEEIVSIDDDENDDDDVREHAEEQERERESFRQNYVPDVGGFDEETDVFNAQGRGGEVKNDYTMTIQELKKASSLAAQLTLREFRNAPYGSDAPDYKTGEPPNIRKFKEHNPIGKGTWRKKKWRNKGAESSAQTSSHPFQKTVDGKKKDPSVHYMRSTIEKKGEGWDAIQRASNQDSDYNDNKFVEDQAWNFHSDTNYVTYRKKQGDLKETHQKRYVPDTIDSEGWDNIQDSASEDSSAEQTRRTREQADEFLHNKHVRFAKDSDLKEDESSLTESLDETMDEMSTTAGIGGYTVPLGGKPANMKRNADVWRRNNQSKNPKANDTVKQNLAPTQSATSVKKDRKKAKAPYTSFADQSNIPFKHKSRKNKYGVSDSPASAIGGE